MVMTMAKITAGDGYIYLTRHVAQGDAEAGRARDATAYYTAQGNPPGAWTGRGAPLLGLAGRAVTEDQMRALFGFGEHPDGGALTAAYLKEHVRAEMSDRQLERVRDEAIAAARLGRAFPAYQALETFDARVQRRLAAMHEQAGREPTALEEKKVRADEARRQRAPVAGFDLVFSPVKSAALLWALDPRERVREAVRAAHEGAVGEALDLVEEHAALTRTGRGGIAQIQTGGLIAAAFEHWDSRAGDPNMHTHVAVSSKVQGADGKWRALDARVLYAMKVTVSEMYNTAFEARLSASLGVSFTARPDTTGGREPVREITGVPFGMIEFFSRRRTAIEARYAELLREYRDSHGHDPAPSVGYQLAQRANLDTRQGKKPPRSLSGKREAWRDELHEAFGAGAVAQLMKAVPSALVARASREEPTLVPYEELAERVVAAVAARRSTWTVWNLRAEAERQIRSSLPFLPPEEHRPVAEKVTGMAASPARSICVEAPSVLDEPTELRRSDGSSVFTVHGASRFTSQAVLDAETRLANAARTPTVCGLSGPSAAAALDRFEARAGTRLDAGQRWLVTAFACDSRLLLAGIGPAGSGKTSAMRALSHVLRESGQRLVPLATSAASADVLGRELGARAENLHKFLHEWTDGPFAARLRAGASVPGQARMFRLHPGDVVLVDEAGMAGTFLLDKLVSVAAARGAIVRLLGDDRQLPAVEGGGALRLVASQPGTPELTELYRFRDPAEARATLQVRGGDPAAIAWYHAAGRIRSGSREAMAVAAYTGWKEDMLAGKITLLAAAGEADVTGLSAQARADRVLAGQVESSGVRLRDGNLAGLGDWIVTRDNQRRLGLFGGRDWVKNGDAWEVARRLEGGSLAVRHLRHGGCVTLPAAYVRAHVQLLYACNAHRVQGGTVDTAHPLITAGMSRESLYVLASRAREKTVFYVATHDQPSDDDARVDHVRRDPRQYAGREILLNALATESAPLSATETITRLQEEAGSLSTLVPRYLHAAQQDADGRYRLAAVAALGEDGGRTLAADSAWGAVARRLFDAEGDGWDPARLLATVASKRELASAESIARVLADRIDAFLADNPSSPQMGALQVQPVCDPVPIPGCPAYESAAGARARLTALAATILGDQLAERARAEVAWPALIAALRRAEMAGFDPADALTRTATTRELRTARSVSEVIAWRVNRHVAAHPADPVREPGAAAAEGSTEPASAPELALLPWVPGPRRTAQAAGTATALAAYISDAATAISARTAELADSAIRHRPPWMSHLGQQPSDPEPAREWRRHIAVIAAYRDQHTITTDDPRQVLGPYVEQGGAAHKAYWHAVGSAFAARQLAGLESDSGTSADSRASAQLAADIYRNLPGDERADIAAMVATTPGTIWLSDPAGPDEFAAVQPAYATQLGSVLAGRGHATGALTFLPERQQAEEGEPIEAALARRGRPGQATGKHAKRAVTGGVMGTQDSRLVQVPPQPYWPPNEPTPVI
jgi:conjugative relaxase-like TrwC/TraI family protein